MAAVGRTIIIVLVVVLGLGAALYFLGPKTASRSQTLEIERPAATVLARLSSTPVGAAVVEGVTISETPTTRRRHCDRTCCVRCRRARAASPTRVVARRRRFERLK